jgi:hypothetical protein
MAEEPNQIKRHIDATRRELSQNVYELGNRAKQATDWHTYFDKSPLTMLALAFSGGVVLSGFVGRSAPRHNGHHPLSSHSPGQHPLSDAGESQSHRGVEARKSEAADMFDTVKGAMIGWTANQFKTLFGELLPGFRQEYERTEREKKSSAERQQRGPLA